MRINVCILSVLGVLLLLVPWDWARVFSLFLCHSFFEPAEIFPLHDTAVMATKCRNAFYNSNSNRNNEKIAWNLYLA